MIKIACNIPNMNDGTSLYRAMGPLGELRRVHDISTHHLSVWSLATLMECDVLFMQRPHTNDHVAVMEMAKDIGIPIWIDYDDLLVNLPTDNPGYFNYMAQEKLRNITYLISSADHITVTTKYLKRQLSKANPKITVVPNAMDMRYKIFRDRPEPPKREKLMAWRGSNTHQRDVFGVCQSILTAHKEHPDWFWRFFGDNLWLITDNMVHERTIVSPPAEWPTYLGNLFKSAPAAMICPLHDHPFNHSKSNIAWMEAAFAGAPTICPDWEEWNMPGALNYTNEQGFLDLMLRVMNGAVDCYAEGMQAWNYVQEELNLERVNKLRWDVLQSIL